MSTNEAPSQFHLPRALWHTRVQIVVFAWMLVALVVVPGIGHVDGAGWVATHAVLLGAVTNALFVWTWHFSAAILRVAGQADRGDEIRRLVVLNAGIGGVLIGVPTGSTFIIIVSAVFVAAAVSMLALDIRAALRRALPSPYQFTARAYLVSTVMLVGGALVAVVLSTVHISEDVEPRVVIAHVTFNLMGWIGIPILATIVTLWPTMLRTRIAPNAALLGRRMLPVLGAAVPLVVIGLVADAVALALVGLAAYLAAFIVTMSPMLRVMRVKPARSFATRSALAGMLWMLASLLLFGVALVRWGIVAIDDHGAGLLVAAVAGGVLQVLLGCMAYLLPAMAAGGPAKVRWRNDIADAAGLARLGVTNAGVVLAVAAPDGARLPGAALLLAGFAWTAITVARTMREPSADEIAAAEAGREWPEETR